MRPGERSQRDPAAPSVALHGPEGETWLGLTDAVLPVAEVGEWIVRPDCGGTVVFTGTARNHAEGRSDVTALEYEAYAEQVLPTFERVASEARRRWAEVGRIAILHRVGSLEVTEAAVVVGVSAPHRHEAFDAARFCIDEVKATAPIWKREHWSGGADWGHTEAEARRSTPSAMDPADSAGALG
jgi:molybdopterin synthase catalytic subunit